MTDSRIFITMMVWLKPGGGEALSHFRLQAAPLFSKYDLRVEQMLLPKGKGQLVGVNPWEVPDAIQILSVPSMDRFRAYVTDPDYQNLAKKRDNGIQRMVATFGKALEVSELNSTSGSARNERLYGVAFLRFKAGGAEGLLEFNRRALSLFVRHGMHVEHYLEILSVLTPVGEALQEFSPERALVFFLDTPSSLAGYVADPEYAQLAPLRDAGLERYDFFLASSP